MTPPSAPPPGPEGLVAYLAALVGSAPAAQLLELRYRRPGGGMGQRFFGVARPDAAAAAIAVLGRRQDVYLGVALRARRERTYDAVAGGWALWADCDSAAAAAALEAFDPAPAIVIQKKPHAVRQVAICKPESGPRAGQPDAELEAVLRSTAFERVYGGEADQPAVEPVESGRRAA